MCRSVGWHRESRNKPLHLWPTDFQQGFQDIHWGKNSFLTYDVRTTGYPHAKDWNWTSTSDQIQKLTYIGSDVILRAKIIKFLEKT